MVFIIILEWVQKGVSRCQPQAMFGVKLKLLMQTLTVRHLIGFANILTKADILLPFYKGWLLSKLDIAFLVFGANSFLKGSPKTRGKISKLFLLGVSEIICENERFWKKIQS